MKSNSEVQSDVQSGIENVNNSFKLNLENHDAIAKKDVHDPNIRTMNMNDCDINILLSRSKFTLVGTVDSWHQNEEASPFQSNTLGIWHLKNKFTAEYDFA